MSPKGPSNSHKVPQIVFQRYLSAFRLKIFNDVYIFFLFLANPGWVLRKPREFLSDLLEQALQMMKSSNPNLETLETITTALVKLLEAQPTLADMVPATGKIHTP